MIANVDRFRVAVAVSALILLAACGPPTQKAAIDPEIASCLPASTQVAAGLRLDAVRRSPLFAKLPDSARSLLDPASGADYLLLAMTPEGVIAAALGNFRTAPPGATLLTPRVALSGSEAVVRQAMSSHAAGTRSELIGVAEPIAAAFPIWIAARGSATLPLTGNLANLNNLLHATRFTTIGLQPSDPVTLDATGICASPAAAERLEETFRAMVSLAKAAGKRAGSVDSIRYHTEGAQLRVAASLPLGSLDSLWNR
jgi:hypothetical protein